MSEVYISYIGVIDKQNIDLLIANIYGCKNQGKARINVELSSHGGDPAVGIAGYNALRGLARILRFYNIGNVDSAGVPLFMAADSRVACPNSSFMLHELSWTFGVNQIHMRDVKPNFDNLTAAQRKMLGIISERTGLASEDVARLFEQTAVLDAGTSAERGFVQAVENIVVPDDAELIHIFPIQRQT